MGAKKKTKKQIEEEKALAEAERKLQEELDRKRAEEEAERQRIAEEKRRAEEEKRRQEELVRLNEQAPFVMERDAAMIEKRHLAVKSRKKDLDDKFLLCDPLPDPKDERDLTTFITLWSESKDKTLQEAVDNCQEAENVIKAINLILGEALAQYDYAKIQWCQEYIEKIRVIQMDKWEKISADIFMYVEKYTEQSQEEREEAMKKNPGRKMDGN